jgi:hypothetical protein
MLRHIEKGITVADGLDVVNQMTLTWMGQCSHGVLRSGRVTDCKAEERSESQI